MQTMVINGIEYSDVDLELFDDGSVHDATLAADAVVQDLPCRGSRSVVFYPSGRLLLAWLSRPHRVGGVPVAAEIVYLHENGSLWNGGLAEPSTIDGVELPVATRMTLDEAGRLLEYRKRLTSDQQIYGLPCTARDDVWCYANGRLSVATLSQPYTVLGTRYAAGTRLQLDPGGNVLGHTQVDLATTSRFKRPIYGAYPLPFE